MPISSRWNIQAPIYNVMHSVIAYTTTSTQYNQSKIQNATHQNLGPSTLKK